MGRRCANDDTTCPRAALRRGVLAQEGAGMNYTKAALKRLLKENEAITLADPRALAERPVSAAE